jgi:hypothetical protein
VSCDIGTATEPTKITLNIVSTNGTYAIGPASLNVTSGGAKTVTLGTGGSAITFNHMYVYKYNYNQTASSKTLTVSLMDHSIAFDKVFVGLVGRHSTDPTLVVPNSVSFPFTVDCTECNTLWPRQVSVGPANVSKVVWSALNTGSYRVQGPGGIDGGYVIMGWEQWTDGNCEIPKVEYTFSELLTVLSAIGYDVTSLVALNRSAVYQASYSGSLREVLNAWASDFSFSFIIDPLNPVLTIMATDLTVPVDLTQVKLSLSPAIGTGDFNSDSPIGAMIRSRSDSVTLENTYRQEPIIKNIKGAKSFTRKQINYTPMTGKPVSVTDAIGPWGHSGRTNYQFQVSIALAKYKPEARMLWLSDQCGQAGTPDAQRPLSDAWPSLGFIPATSGGAGGAQGDYGITDVGQKEQLVQLFNQDNSNSAFQHPIWKDPNNYWVYIGVWNEAYQGAMESFDAELADFYNKWAYWYGCPWNDIYKTFDCGAGMMMTNPPASFRECPVFADGNKYYDYAAEIKTLPESKFYQKGAYPFQDILRANAGAFYYTQNQGVVDPHRVDGDAIFELADNAWGTSVEHMENLFANKWVLDQGNAANWDPNLAPQSSLDHFMPIYARFDANQVLDAELRNILPAFKYDFLKSTARSQGYFPGIAIIPKLSQAKLSDPTTGMERPILEVGPLITQTNGVAYDNVRRRRLEQVGDNAKDCTIYCEEDIVQNMCECPAIVDPLHKWPFDPLTGVNHFIADAFQIGHLGSYKTIIFPIGADYIGYWKSDVTMRGTYPKEIDIFGAPAFPVGNVMESKVVDVDVTQEINPPEMGIGTQFVLAGHPAPVSFTTYATAIASMNQQSLFPGETINVKVDGIEFQGLVARGLLSPQAGLTNFSVSMDESGMSTDLTYSSRVPKMPKRDVWMQKVGPRATQGRTGGALAGRSGSGNPGTNAVGAFPW